MYKVIHHENDTHWICQEYRQIFYPLPMKSELKKFDLDGTILSKKNAMAFCITFAA